MLGQPRNKAPDEAHLYPEREFVAELDSDGTHIQVSRPDGTVERLAIEDLSSISIVTNASGPWGMDVWWVLENAAQDTGCIFPMGATGEKASGVGRGATRLRLAGVHRGDGVHVGGAVRLLATAGMSN